MSNDPVNMDKNEKRNDTLAEKKNTSTLVTPVYKPKKRLRKLSFSV